jgi:hypothetical protein
MVDMQREIKTAVAWWKDILGTTSEDHLIPASSEQQLDVFAGVLQARLEQYFQEHITCWLFVDYYPVPDLAEAAKAAGMNPDTVFPWKTEMTIRSGNITVCIGPGKPYNLVLSD